MPCMLAVICQKVDLMTTGRVESVQEFTFTLTRYDNGRVTVVLKSDGHVSIADVDLATKYMMWICSNNTEVSFDEAMRALIEGAAGFEGVGIRVLPGGAEETPSPEETITREDGEQ